MAKSRGATVEQKLKSHIENFRTAVSGLDPDQRRRVPNLEDFSAPCQIHVFWIRANSNQHYSLLVLTRLSEVEDGRVRVLGPIHPADAIDTLTKAANASYWDAPLKDPGFLLSERDRTYRPVLASDLASAIEKFDVYIIQRVHSKEPAAVGITSKSIFPGNGFAWDMYGDPRCIDLDSTLEELVKEAEKAPPRKLALDGTASAPPKAPPPTLGAFVTWFFPRIWIGDLPVLTVEEVLERKVPREIAFAPKALEGTIGDRKVFVNRDGMVGIESESAHQALDIVNRIMAAALLLGIEVRVVRESELGEGKLDSKNLEILGWSREEVSQRTTMKLPFEQTRLDIDLMPLTTIQVSEGQVELALELSEVIGGAPYLSTISVLYLEAHTHLRESAYSQCFLMAWMVIESWLANEWVTVVEKHETSRSHRDRLEDSRSWTASVKAETLRMLEVIDAKQLRAISTFREKRNRVIHKSYQPNEVEAERILDFAAAITKSAIQAVGNSV